MERPPSKAQLTKVPAAESFIAFVECDVLYQGRASSQLPRGRYVIIRKPDRSFAIHGSDFKPINYQPAGSQIFVDESATPQTILVTRQAEKILVRIHRLFWVQLMPGLARGKLELFGSEQQMVDEWLVQNKHKEHFPDCQSVFPQFPTGHGPADLLITLSGGFYVVVEAKRKVAGIQAYSQVMRYRDWIYANHKAPGVPLASNSRHLVDLPPHVRPYILAPRITKTALGRSARAGRGLD
jgi:RecB family endonuclease NucS